MTTELTNINQDWYKDHMSIGMSGVDPTDITPPQILLMQKTSDLSAFMNPNGSTPKVGQFVHNTTKQIYDSFDCYILAAIKTQWINRRKNPPESEDMYKVVGAMSDTYELFGISFRGTATKNLGALFGSAVNSKRPLFSIKIKLESKFIQGDVNSWYVPIVRILNFEEDPAVLQNLSAMAIQADGKMASLKEEKGENSAFMENLVNTPKKEGNDMPF